MMQMKIMIILHVYICYLDSSFRQLGHSFCNKNFQILLTSDFYQLADDANENLDYIACLSVI